jgi:osmotically-inducible protein OsmY
MKRLVLPLIFIVMLLASACSPQDQRAAQRGADDALIVATVRARAAAIDAASLSLLHVACTTGVVTLTGDVHSSAERASIESAARAVKGVSAVIDRTVVNPRAPTSAQIAGDLELATQVHADLAAQIGVNAARVHVDVHRGVVTLTGTLPSVAHRQVADETVRSIHGVKRLDDDITISPQ